MRTGMLALAAVVLLLTACQPSTRPATGSTSSPGGAVAQQRAPGQEAAAGQHSPEVQRLLAAARDNGETELGVAWCECSLNGSQGAKQFEALFNRMYGTNIKVNFAPIVSMPEIAGKVTQELAAGQRASTGILLATDAQYAVLLTRGVMEEYDYALLSPRIIRDVIASNNIGVQIAGSGISGIAYNSELVAPSEVPRRLEDVLHPKWKGRIASTQQASYFERVAYRPEWTAEKMKAFVTRLSEHIGGQITTGDMTRIGTGEFAMLVLGGHTQVLRERYKGAPLGFVIPEDGAITGFLHMGVPRNAAQPNLSKLFINMILSEEGQRLIYEAQHTDHHALPGSQSAADLRELSARGVEVVKFEVRFLADHPEMDELSRELGQILREKRSS
jgi:ABC-type Fe3+ transport system substrate-binding protein